MGKVFPVFLCDCKINKLEQSSIDFHINTYINECYHEERNVFAAFCKTCPCNVSSGFESNYFSAMNCGCYAEPCHFFPAIVQDLNTV